MLGKLFKHEWKASIRVYALLYMLAAVFTVAVVLYRGAFQDFAIRLDSGWLRTIIFAIEGLLGVGYILVLIVVNVLTLVYLIYRFYQTMVCDEAYLTHTLPVTTGQLILVKSVMAFCFQVIAAIVTILSFCCLVAASGSWNDMITTFSELIRELKETGFWCGSLAVTVILGILLFIVSLFFSILTYYMCISAGNLFNSHKLLGSIVVYFVFNIVIRVVSLVLIVFGMWTAEKRLDHMIGLSEEVSVLDEMIISHAPQILDFVNSYLAAGFVLMAAASAALFAVSRYLLKNRLNLA